MNVFNKLIFGAVVMMCARVSWGAPFNAGEFNALPSKDRFELAISMLETRDLSLKNFSCKVHQRVVPIMPKDGTPHLLVSGDLEVRRLNERIFGIEVTHPYGEEVDQVLMKSERVWDGTTLKSLGSPPYDGQSYHVGTIQVGESWSIGQIKLYNLFGLRGPSENYIADSLASWIKHERDIPVQVETQAIDEGVSIKIQVGPRLGLTFVLDPLRDFMIDKMVTFLQGKSFTVDDTLEVTKSHQVKGIWVPSQAIEKVTGTNLAHPQITTLEFQEVSIGEVTDADVTIEFPLGSHVVDTIRRVDYVINSDGTFKLDPLAISEEGVVRIPTTRSVGQIDDTTTDLYKESPIIGSNRTMPEFSIMTARVALIILSSLSSLLAVSFLIYWFQRSRRKRVP